MDNNSAFDFDAILSAAVADADLGSREIPNIDLYLDQILTLAADRLAQNQRGDKLLTKTMINNYTKDGLIKPVKGKKYDREHIVQMLLVYSLKQTLSIGEIKRAMDGVYATEGFDGEALQRLIAGMGVETLEDLQPEDIDEEEILPDASVYDLIRFVVKDLEAEGKIDCPCHSGCYDLRYAPGGIQVYCPECGAAKFFPCRSASSAIDYVNDTDYIKLS